MPAMSQNTEEPRVNLRFVKKDNRFILQQLWVVTIRDHDGKPREHTPEWRDVPLIEDVDTTRMHEIRATRASTEIERLRSILRRCMGGTTMIEIAPGEITGLYQFKPEDADASR